MDRKSQTNETTLDGIVVNLEQLSNFVQEEAEVRQLIEEKFPCNLLCCEEIVKNAI